MATATLKQFSFNRGELDPALHCRSDWKYYFSGAEKLVNLLTRTQGGAVKRGGLRLVTPALDESCPSRLVPFRFSVRQSYMLEFSDRKIRIIKDGGVVVYPVGHDRAGQEVVIDSPYSHNDLAEVRHAQTADVMILTHPNHAPRRLSRHDHHEWELAPLFPTSRLEAPTSVRIVVSGGDSATYVVTAGSDKGGESAPSDPVVALHDNNLEMDFSGMGFSELYSWLYGRNYGYIPDSILFHAMYPEQMIAFLRGCGYADHGVGLRENGSGGWQWMHQKPDGRLFQTVDWWPNSWSELINECLYACEKGWAGNALSLITAAAQRYIEEYNGSLVGSRISELAWDPVDGAAYYRVYRAGSSGGQRSYRLLGQTETTGYRDENFDVQDITLPDSVELFDTLDEYPGVCAFFEQRLILGRTNEKPTTFWGSEIGQYNAFGRHSPILDTDSYEFTLASGEMNEIHWIVPLNELLFGTSGGEWKAGGGGAAITPANVNARVQSWYGCAALPPLVIGRTVIFAGRSRRTVRSLSYSLDADGYSGIDLTAYASHLFAGRTISDMCYQQEPSGVIWVVMSDGEALSCTYRPEEEVVSWSRHVTAGTFESCASLIDTDGSDHIYFCVAREVGGKPRRFIESLSAASDLVDEEEEGFFVDCGLSYQGNAVNRVTGLDHLEGETVVCLADGSVFTGLVVTDGGITLPDSFTASTIHAGLPYSAELWTLEAEPDDGETLRNRARFAVSATIRFLKSRECLCSHDHGNESEMKFRTSELPGRPIRLFTGERSTTFTSPPGCRSVRLQLRSVTPTPFTVLGILVECRYGQPA